LNVSINANHTWVGDLIFTLVHQDSGTTVTMIDRPGYTGTGFGCSSDNIDVELDDEGVDGPVENQCAANPALFGNPTPNNPLNAFDTEDTSGTWILNISDGAGGDTGVLNEWCLIASIPPTSGPAINLAKTVSTDGSCGTTDTITVGYGTDVTYCYEVTNTGDVTFTLHTLVDDQLGTLLNDFPYQLNPGTSTFVTQTVALTQTTTNTATWTATDGVDTAADDDSATVTVVVTPTIDVDPDAVSSTQATNSVVTQTLTINNLGLGSTLDWTITETTVIPAGILTIPSGTGQVPQPAKPGETLSSYAEGGLPLPTVSPDGLKVVTGAASSGGLTYYSDRPTFDGDNPGLPIEDFEEGNVASGGVLGCPAPLDENSNNACFIPGDILPGVLFQDDIGPDPVQGLVILGAGFNGNPSVSILANTFVDSFDIFFTDPTVTAAGMELQSHFAADTINITIYAADGTTVIDTTTAASTNAGSFWGVAADQPIGRIKIFSPANQAEGIDNIAFGNAAPACAYADIPWLTVSPLAGSVAGGEGEDVAVVFDSTGYATGTYTGTLCVESNDPVTPLVTVPVTMTVVTPIYGVELSGDDALTGDVGTTVTYTLQVTNTSNVVETFDLTVGGNTWTTTLSAPDVTLNPGESDTFTAVVEVPAGASDGEIDVATVTATSQADGSVSDSADLTTSANVPVSYGVELSGNDALTDTAGSTVVYTVLITNTGNATDTFDLAVSGNTWTATLSDTSLTLGAGESGSFTVSVDIAATATDGETDTVTVTATSQGDGSVSDSADLTTTATEVSGYTLFLPIIFKP
jgi:hypothetical protein